MMIREHSERRRSFLNSIVFTLCFLLVGEGGGARLSDTDARHDC